MSKVILKKIKKTYSCNTEEEKRNGGFTDILNFNLVIQDKEFIILVGPQGCGGSTVLRMIAGLEEITEGELYFGDRLINDVPTNKRDIAMVSQNNMLYPHMTVYENIAYGLTLGAAKEDSIVRRIEEVAELLGIAEILKHKPSALHGEQHQRVAIYQALIREPQVLLLDEPLRNLDEMHRNQMCAELIKIQKSVNTTFVYYTHDPNEALMLGDRVVVLKDGGIQQIGTPQEIKKAPKNIFVAEYTGTQNMNFINAELYLDNSKYRIRILDKNIELSEDKQRMLKDKNQRSCEVILGVYPQDIYMSVIGVGNSMFSKVDISGIMGKQVSINAEVGDSTVKISIPVFDLFERFGFEEGEENHIYLSFSNANIFDKNTKENLLYID